MRFGESWPWTLSSKPHWLLKVRILVASISRGLGPRFRKRAAQRAQSANFRGFKDLEAYPEP